MKESITDDYSNQIKALLKKFSHLLIISKQGAISYKDYAQASEFIYSGFATIERIAGKNSQY